MNWRDGRRQAPVGVELRDAARRRGVGRVALSPHHILWGVGYHLGPIRSSLSLYKRILKSAAKRGGQEVELRRLEKVCSDLNYGFRLMLANAIADSLQLQEQNPDLNFKTYEEWRTALMLSMEKLSGSIGPRLAGQWEILGLLQTLNCVWMIGFVVNVFAALYNTLDHRPDANAGVFFTLAGLMIGLWIGTTYSYHYRNCSLAKDVAYATQVLNKLNDKSN